MPKLAPPIASFSFNRMLIRGRPLTLSRIARALRVEAAKARARVAPFAPQRSRYGPRLSSRRADHTFGLCVAAAYGDLIPATIRSIEEPFCFVDIGANIGVFSLVAGAVAQCEQVFAFEPVPETFSLLVENIALSKLSKVVPICAAVVSGGPSIVRLDYNPRHSGTSALSTCGNVTAVAIDYVGLDALLASTGPRRKIVKIDVEGAELSVLDALEASSAFQSISDVIVEISQQRGVAAAAALPTRLDGMGFREVRRSSNERTHYDAHFHRAI